MHVDPENGNTTKKGSWWLTGLKNLKKKMETKPRVWVPVTFPISGSTPILTVRCHGPTGWAMVVFL